MVVFFSQIKQCTVGMISYIAGNLKRTSCQKQKGMCVELTTIKEFKKQYTREDKARNETAVPKAG